MNIKNYIRQNWTPEAGCKVRVCRPQDGLTRDLQVTKHNKWHVEGFAISGKRSLMLSGDVRQNHYSDHLIKEGSKLDSTIPLYLLSFEVVEPDYKWVKPKPAAPVGVAVPIVLDQEPADVYHQEETVPAESKGAPLSVPELLAVAAVLGN